jgi:phosphoglycolate phosphatase
MTASDHLRFAAFDLDGTLIDSAETIVDGVVACWAACGFAEPDRNAVRRVIGLPWEESIRELIPGSGATELAAIHNYHDEVRRGIRPRPPATISPFPGAHEVLDHLEAEGYLLGIVTSRSSHRLHDLLDDNGLAERFQTFKTADMGPGKPNPYLLLEAMADLGVDAGRTVMIGDTTFDVLMATNAGTAAVGVSWGVHEPHELDAAGAHCVIDAFHELPPILGTLVSG